jgi:SAM-dependent methyltransferase
MKGVKDMKDRKGVKGKKGEKGGGGERKGELFDRDLLRRRRLRFAPVFSRHDFLLRRAAGDMLARLDMVLRDFPLALDMCAGHGLLAPALAARANIGRVVAADFSREMLISSCDMQAAWGRRGHEEDEKTGGKIELLACDEENIPLKPGSVNLATSLFYLHYANDPLAVMAGARRLLAPDGLFMAALPGGNSLAELRACFMQAEEEIYGGVSPRITPMAGIRDWGDLLLRAGFALPVVDSDMVSVSYGDFWDMLRELRAMGAGNIMRARRREAHAGPLLRRAKEIYESRYAQEGRLQVSFEIIHLSGWAPHESQQKPLAPGSVPQGFACAARLPEDDDGDGGDGGDGGQGG